MSQQDQEKPRLRLAASRPDGTPEGDAPPPAAGPPGQVQAAARIQMPAPAQGRALVPARGRILSRAQYSDFLPEIEAVAEREHSPLARTLVIAVAILFVIAVVWSALAEVDQVAVAQGQVRPAGHVRVINHPEGGTVSQLYVREGQAVKEGDLLLVLDPQLVEEELGKNQNEWQALSAEVARLMAEATGKGDVDFPPELVAERPDLVANHRQLFVARRNALESQRAVADELIRQRESAVVGLREQVATLQIGLDVLEEQERAISTLAGKGYFPKLRYLSVKREVATARGQLSTGRQDLISAESALQEVHSRRASIDRDRLSEVLERLAAARIERDRTFRTMQQQKSRLDSLEMRAPVNGVVPNLKVANTGQAVRPGDPIMNVVPTGETLIVEAQVSNADIGYIHIGQSAKVKIVTYDYVRYGELEGEVEQISATSVANEKTGETFFPVQIRVNRTYMGKEPGDKPVTPGMTAQVDMKTGERSILSYLTDRVTRTTSEAFTER